jgi:copper chaperone CopZ
MKKLLLIAASTLAIGCPSTNHHGGGNPYWPLNSAPIVNPLGPPTYVVHVKGLVCPSCAVGLKKALMKLPFIRSIHVNYNTGITLIYEVHPRDDHKGVRKFDKSRITKAIKDSGYEVDKFKGK